MFSFFRKKPSSMLLEQQLQALAECGIRLNPAASLDDLFMFHSREEHEAEPFKELIPTLGFDREPDPFDPICNRLWMCDHERVEDHGAYASVIARLHQMSEESLPISGITDHVDIEAETAWVEFDLAGSRVRWDAEVNNDWLDPSIILRFDELLRAHRAPLLLYSNRTEFGQSEFFACLTPAEFARFRKLATFKLAEIGGA